MTGRPTLYTPELAKRVCELIADGWSLRRVAQEVGVPERTIRRWVIDDREGFAAPYARARDVALDRMADEIIELADDKSNDRYELEGKRVPDSAAVNRSRLMVDARKWYLSKLAPKRYGDRLELEHGVTVDLVEVLKGRMSALGRDPTP
jgi:hypothetical protein